MTATGPPRRRGIRRPGWRELLDIPRIVLVAALVEVGVRAVPLPRLVPWLGVSLTAATSPDASERATVELSASERRRLRVARGIARRWPVGDGPCLREALLVGHVLRRHRPLLRIGVARGATRFEAHAWIEVAGGTIGASGGYHPLEFPAGVPTWR